MSDCKDCKDREDRKDCKGERVGTPDEMVGGKWGEDGCRGLGWGGIMRVFPNCRGGRDGFGTRTCGKGR